MRFLLNIAVSLNEIHHLGTRQICYPKLLSQITFLSLLIALLLVCSCAKDSQENQITDLIAKIENAAEKKDLFYIRKHISEDYSDKYHQNKRDIQRILAGFFLQNQNPHIFSHIDSLLIRGKTSAEVRLYIEKKEKKVTEVQTLQHLSADFHRLDIVLLLQDDIWQLRNAKRTSAKLEDFF
ncbi:MAG: hypothetical protein GY705_17825 [Bacteroidetes bacterium]|nr:hypothetical protein [Bacteroidota bacterium]